MGKRLKSCNEPEAKVQNESVAAALSGILPTIEPPRGEGKPGGAAGAGATTARDALAQNDGGAKTESEMPTGQ